MENDPQLIEVCGLVVGESVGRFLQRIDAVHRIERPEIALTFNFFITVSKINDKPKLELSNYSHFRRVLKAGFSQRRKNIKNCLVNGGFDKNLVKSTLEKLNIDENIRGESLSIEKFGELSEALLAGVGHGN